MPINIRNREVEQLIDELRHETGRGITEIVLDLRRRIEALAARYRARLPAMPQTPEAIVGYDERGLPS